MHISIQVCSIIIVLFLVIIFSRQKKLGTRSERIFLEILIITLISLVLDISSVAAIYYKESCPGLLVLLISKTYLISLIILAFVSRIYVLSDVNYVAVDGKKGVFIRYAIITMCVLLVSVLPIDFNINADTGAVWSSGYSVIMTYVTVFAILLNTIYTAFDMRTSISSERFESVLIWIGFWCIAAVIQAFMRNHILIVGFASALGVMVIYIKFENPELNIDRATGLYNQKAFLIYVNNALSSNKDISIVSASFERWYNRNVSFEYIDTAKSEIIRFLSDIDKVMVFRNYEDELIMVYENKSDAAECGKIIDKRFKEGWGPGKDIIFHPFIVYLRDASGIKRAEDILHFIAYIKSDYMGHSDQHFISITNDIIENMYNQRNVVRQIVEAMDQDGVEVFFQPIYSVKEKRFTCAEALVRIRQRDGILMLPGMFIETAEKSGLIMRLGLIVFEKVCQFIKDNPLEKMGMEYIEVNLSMVQCAYKKLSDDYINIMKKYNINPCNINLEITESALMEDKTNLLDNINRLMEYGVKFSLDDFGTGHSNLNYIVDMPVNIVKFDKGMLDAYFENGRAKYVMDAAMHMIQGMNLEIVAEGIETKEHFENIAKLGINFVQGYYFSKPVTAQQFLLFINENNK